MSHISEEIIEGLYPTRTDSNSSTTVMTKSGLPWIVTALKHIPISPVFWRSPVTVREMHFSLKAAAAYCGSFLVVQIFPKYFFLFSAITTAKPKTRMAHYIGNALKNFKSSKSFTLQCKRFAHNAIIIRETIQLNHREVRGE